MKPLQAAVSLRRIRSDLPGELVAIMCASHTGEPSHVRAVRRLLRWGGASESRLRCPPAFPALMSSAIGAGRMRRVYHNCSGKHAGMLAACAGAGWPLEGYLEPSSPLQRSILRAVRRATGVERPEIGVDGCGAPVFGVALSAMATLFARLVRPDRLGALSPAVSRAVRAMRTHPFLVAGTGRIDTDVMSAVPGVVSKVGAEGLVCAGLVDRGIGVAVKIEDGGDRAAGPALIRALRLLDAITDEQAAGLPHARPPVLGGGRPVGELGADFRFRRP
jgi:L-asparaginase II